MKNQMTYDDVMELLAPAIDDYLILVDASEDVLHIDVVGWAWESDFLNLEKMEAEQSLVRSMRERLEEAANSIDDSGMETLHFDGFVVEWVYYSKADI